MSTSTNDVWTYVDEKLASLGFDVLRDDAIIEDTMEALEQVTFVRDDKAHMVITFDQPREVMPDSEELEDAVAEAISKCGRTATIQSNLTYNVTHAKPVICVEEIDYTSYTSLHFGIDKAIEYLCGSAAETLGEERPESIDELNDIIQGSEYSYMLFEVGPDGEGFGVDLEDYEANL